jgi:hypothetical protein
LYPTLTPSIKFEVDANYAIKWDFSDKIFRLKRQSPYSDNYNHKIISKSLYKSIMDSME